MPLSKFFGILSSCGEIIGVFMILAAKSPQSASIWAYGFAIVSALVIGLSVYMRHLEKANRLDHHQFRLALGSCIILLGISLTMLFYSSLKFVMVYETSGTISMYHANQLLHANSMIMLIGAICMFAAGVCYSIWRDGRKYEIAHHDFAKENY